MALSYTWELTSLKKTSAANLSNVIVGTRWDVTGTDENGNSGKFSGATPFNLSTVDPNNFIAYENLTANIVLGWIQAVVVGDYKAHIDGQIQKQIDAQINPVEEVSGNTFPWSV